MFIQIPRGKLSASESLAAEKRKKLREALLKGNTVISNSGEVKDKKEVRPEEQNIQVPQGKLASKDNTFSEKRKKLRKALLKGNTVISNSGEVKDKKEVKPEEQNIQVPQGKLAYWYEDDKELFSFEKQAMQRFFPQFKLDKLEDGRLYWVGHIQNPTGENTVWHLQAVYENNHPSNSSWGGSVTIYPIEPTLEELKDKLDESIPHTLTDSEGFLYMCTGRKSDIRTGNRITTAASSLSWAIKWIASFELWLAGNLTTEEFRDDII